MKTRYTGKSLEHDVEQMNKQLEVAKNDFRFVVGYRYNYTAIDLATPEQVKRHCCHSTLQCGTPRECLAACHEYMSKLLPVA